jgi:hypothetical protein
LPNGANGVLIDNGSNNTIGAISAGTNGTSGGPANIIAFNAASGVLVGSGTGNAVHESSIFGNALLGIDLGPGANGNPAPPVITSVRRSPLGVQVSGTLTGTPNTAYVIEFFANDASEPSGRSYIGSQVVSADATGSAAFAFFGPLPPTGSPFVTATATDPNNNTSEFSAAG